MKRYVKADNSGYNFYVTDCLDMDDYLYVSVESKDFPEFDAELEVRIDNEVQGSDYTNQGDMSDEEFDEIVDNNWEYIEDAVADYLFDNEYIYMDSRGFIHKIYR